MHASKRGADGPGRVSEGGQFIGMDFLRDLQVGTPHVGIIDIEVSEHLAVDLNRRSVALDLLEARWESDPLVDVGFDDPEDTDG